MKQPNKPVAGQKRHDRADLTAICHAADRALWRMQTGQSIVRARLLREGKLPKP